MTDNNKKKKNIFTFFLKMFLIFILLDTVMIILASIISSSSMMHKYGFDLITEFFYALAILIVMLLFHNSYVFTTKKEKFWTGVCLAIPMLVISFATFFLNVVNLETFSLAKFINVLLLSIFVGVAEEFLCRGWLQNEFIERFSSNRKETILSILLASLVFGFMHILNLGTQSLFETILQIVNAAALGMLLGSVYYKTKNIWSVIFLHSFYDFSIFLGEMNNIKDCTYNTPTLSVAAVSSFQLILISSIWIACAFYVFNKCEFANERRKNQVKIGNELKLIMTILLILMLIPYEKLLPEYNQYEVCYKYEEIESMKNYIVHYPYKTEYVIDTNVQKITYDTDAFSDELQMNENTESLKYTFKLNNNETVNVKSNSTGYEIKLNYKNVVDLEVLENEDKIIIAIETTENETTVYYYEVLKTTMANESAFMSGLNKSFTKFELPEIQKMGYLTLDNSDTKYVVMVSKNSDEFIVMNNQLFLIKEK